jgi:hypothetical protein
MDEYPNHASTFFAVGECAEAAQRLEREYPRERLQLVETVATPFRPVPQAPGDEMPRATACRRKRVRREKPDPDQSPYAYWFDPASVRGDSLRRRRMRRSRAR